MNISKVRFKIYFGLVFFYVAIACVVACALLRNITIHQNQIKREEIKDHEEEIKNENDLVRICATSEELKHDSYLNCSLLDKLSYEQFVSNGWTKSVFSAKLEDKLIAIKIVNLKGKDINDCAKFEPLLSCHNKAVEKLEREIQLLKLLKHPTIIQLIYHCSKTIENMGPCMKYSVIATEIGEPLTNLKLLQMNWNDRKKLIQDLANLIHFAQQSPIGVLGLPDLRRTQFVLVNGQLKLADLDDVTVGDPNCTSNTDCSGKQTQRLISFQYLFHI